MDFDHKNITFNFTNAIHLADLANTAYATEQQIADALQKWGYSQQRYIQCRDTVSFVAATNDFIVISFRGTQDIGDWMTDIDTFMISTPIGNVHRGFYHAIDRIWSDLIDTINQYQKNNQSLWFTGHSLGAALATLAVNRLDLEQRKSASGLYTFGSPRVGDIDFSVKFNSTFESRTFRFVNNNDIVTRVPTREMGYEHVGSLEFFDSSGDLHSEISFWNEFMSRVKGDLDLKLGLLASNVENHFMSRYIDNLNKNA